MRDKELPLEVRRLVWQHLPSIDHVALVLALRATLEGATARELAERTSLSEEVATSILRDLTAAGLAREDSTSSGSTSDSMTAGSSTWRFDPSEESRQAVTLLQECYDTRPVTLVRAIYDRPASVAQLFADAFRLRHSEDR